MTIKKLDSATPDITAQNVARIAELFPECVTEGPWGTASDAGGPVIDFDLLRQALSKHVVEGPQERYRLDWPGKRGALLAASTPIDKTLRPIRDDSVDFETTRNVFIEGDNLDALKLLQETYLGKVKMIYIDPPYNTGNDFIYKDDFSQNRETYDRESGQRDANGGRLVANPQTNGRFHSDWLSMIYPRLKLARNLLADDGLIFISIDDSEQANLKLILDEVFGSSNFLECFVWKRTYGGGAKERFAVTLHDYVFLYAKNIQCLSAFTIPYDPETVKRYYKHKDQRYDVRGPFRLQPLEAGKNMDRRVNLDFTVVVNGIDVAPKRQWLWEKSRIEAGLANDTVVFSKSEGGTTLNYKQYLRDEDGNERGSKPTSWIDEIYNQHGSAEVQELFDGDVVFSFPKPTKLIEYFIDIACASSDIIVDFFVGSGTVPHAVFNANVARGKSLSWIAVQLDEAVESSTNAQHLGFKQIAEISRERIRRAGARVQHDHSDLTRTVDTGFRAFRIDSGNLHDTRTTPAETTQAALSGMISHIKDDRSDEDLLFGALLRWGVDITLPIAKRKVLGRTVWFVDPPAEGETGVALIACFAKAFDGKGGIDTELADALGALAPLRVLFRDDGFASDAVKENVASRLKQRAPDTAVRVL